MKMADKQIKIENEIIDLNPSDFDLGIFEQQNSTSLVLGNKKVTHNQLLDFLLATVIKVDFIKRSGQELSTTLKKKHFLIIVIEEILSLAKTSNWGLCKKNDFTYLYNGAYWKLISSDDIKRFLGFAAEKMGIDKFDAMHYHFREQLYKQFLTTAYLPNPNNDNSAVLFNLKNGTFEVKSSGVTLRKFEQEDFLTYQLPFNHNIDATAPLFKKYLNRVLPDKEKQNILAEYLAYVFTPHLKLEKTLLLYGSGANGKSVFFEIVGALLGQENVTNYTLTSLTNDNGYYRAKLGNALVNYASEISGKMETAIFKQLVSGEPVEARLPYGEPFTLKRYARLIFNCNELPKDVEQTKAYFRRFLIIPFDITIPEEEQDKELSSKITENELSGVFNWVLKGLDRILKQKKFSPCKAADDLLSKYKRESDSVQLFLDEESYQKHPVVHVSYKELYSNYRMYCHEVGCTPVKRLNFKKRLTNLGVMFNKTNRGMVVFLKKINV